MTYKCLSCFCIGVAPGTSSGDKGRAVGERKQTTAEGPLEGTMKGLLGGRARYMQARKLSIEGLWMIATKVRWSDSKIQLSESKSLKQTLKKNAAACIAFCRVVGNLVKAGLEELANDFARGVAVLNGACKRAHLSTPSVPLDLVYLQDGKNITWASVQFAAADMAREAIASFSQKMRAFAETCRQEEGQELMIASAPSAVAPQADQVRSYKVGFLSHDLFRRSATLDLAGQSITGLDCFPGEQYRVYVYSIEEEEFENDQSSQSLVKHFKGKGRCRQWKVDEGPETMIRDIVRDGLDLLVHMPGFNHGKQYIVLAAKPAKSVAQWLGCAGPIGDSRLVDYTICSRGLWTPSSGSECAVFFDNMYPLPFGEQLELPSRARDTALYFGLPEGRRRLCLPGLPRRLRQDTITTALHILAECGHGTDSPVLCIMLDAGCESMFTSVLCWAEEWRAGHCKTFDIGRILPFRFVTETGEYQRFLVQMHVFIDTYPCGLHTSLLEPIALCMCVVALRRPSASWPALVASTMLVYGGYEELVALTCEDFITKTVKYLLSKEETDSVELRMREDRAAKRGMYNTDRISQNFAVAVPLIVDSTRRRAGGDSTALRDIDVTSRLPPMPPGGSRLIYPEAQKEQDLEHSCKLLLSSITKYKFQGAALDQACKVLLCAAQSGVRLSVLAGTGASCHAFKGQYMKDGNKRVPKGKELILKVAHGGSRNNQWSRISELSTDPNFRAVYFMEELHKVNSESEFVVKAMPIFSRPTGVYCAAGYVLLGDGPDIMTFQCCEAMSSDLLDSCEYQSMVAEFRQEGYISDARNRFERGMFQMVQDLNAKNLYVMDLSLGNLALCDGLPCAIDLSSSVVLAQSPSSTSNAIRVGDHSKGTHDAKDGLVLFTFQEVFHTVRSGGSSQIPNGFGTQTCRSEVLATQLHENRKKPLKADFAARFDLSSAAMVVLQGYIPVKNGGGRGWVDKQKKALESPDAMYEFLCSGLYPRVKPQQPDALRKRAELFHGLLSEQQQLTASMVLTQLDSLAPEAAPSKVCLLDDGRSLLA